ncbi:MAG: DUF1330 domain-containing protein [Gammaproteobacteria bacterium]|nr:DUF1330 domain-containing protein [Gammaproteobacteria bacterium]
MEVRNAVVPTPEGMQAFLAKDIEGPVSMVNLLKFKEKAEYADGRETDLTGAEAYGLYGQDMTRWVTSHGGRLLFSGPAHHLVLGEADELWDQVAIVEYPSKEAFVQIVSAPEVAEWGVHRAAGLEGQLLIAVTATGTLEARLG